MATNPGKKVPVKTPEKKVPRKKIAVRLFPTGWCMWDHGVSVEHLLMCLGSSDRIDRSR